MRITINYTLHLVKTSYDSRGQVSRVLNRHHLFDSRDPSTIKLSSSKVMISAVESPRSNNSPRFLNGMNDSSCPAQSFVTVLSFASMSLSFTADMQMSFNTKEAYLSEKPIRVNPAVLKIDKMIDKMRDTAFCRN